MDKYTASYSKSGHVFSVVIRRFGKFVRMISAESEEDIAHKTKKAIRELELDENKRKKRSIF